MHTALSVIEDVQNDRGTISSHVFLMDDFSSLSYVGVALERGDREISFYLNMNSRRCARGHRSLQSKQVFEITEISPAEMMAKEEIPDIPHPETLDSD